MDESRVQVRVADIPQQSADYTMYMVTYGRDFSIVDVHAEPLLSGVYPDSVALTESLAHEFVHVIARQTTMPDVYALLPDWFQEGLPVLLIAQKERKLASRLVDGWEEPTDLLKEFELPLSQLAGFYILQEARRQLGPERFLDFVDGVLKQGSVEAGFSSLELSEATVIDSARSRMREDVAKYVKQEGGRFARCMSLYQEGRNKRLAAIHCFETLIEELPETESAAASHYWLAKCFYHIERFSDARVWFEKFLSHSDYGLRDDAQYYDIRMLTREERVSEAKEACEAYLRFYPYGNHLEKVTSIYRRLPESGDHGR